MAKFRTLKTEGEGSIQIESELKGEVALRLDRMMSLGGRLNRRSAIAAWSAAVIGLGLFLGWGWIVAAGLSSLVLGILPCAAMCALGLCAGGWGSKGETQGSSPSEPSKSKR